MVRRVLVLGLGDVGSAVAHRLFQAGELVVIQDGPHPVAARRRMAFVDVVFDGEAQLTGVIARQIAAAGLSRASWTIRYVPVTTAAPADVIKRLTPDVIVDARMHKRGKPGHLRRLAQLTIGLGPGFVAGDNVDLAVETSWENLGRILRRGPTLPFRGEPRAIAGHGRDRYVYAPVAGVFSSKHEIGDAVKEGEAVAGIGRRVIKAPLAGRLRGLTRPGVTVTKGAKVVEVVPTGAAEKVSGIGERPRRIAEAVLTLVRELKG